MKLILGIVLDLCSWKDVLSKQNGFKHFQALKYFINDTAVWLKVRYEIYNIGSVVASIRYKMNQIYSRKGNGFNIPAEITNLLHRKLKYFDCFDTLVEKYRH